MDMMSNPGFVRDPDRQEEIIREMVHQLSRKTLVCIITDYTSNISLYDKATPLPALPHALIDTSGMTSIADYTANFKNIHKKLKVFTRKGGEYVMVENKLDSEFITALKNCFIATSEKSIFYLPYQDLYLKSALHTSGTYLGNVYYFVAMMNGHFIGYQAAIKTGKHLNALHGAFDRNLKTTQHAYDILFAKMTEFAIKNGLEIIDFGAVLNRTKQRMVNRTLEMSYYLMSRNRIIQWFFGLLLKHTRIQGSEQLKFRGIADRNEKGGHSG
jgi:hypothetical protein